MDCINSSGAPSDAKLKLKFETTPCSPSSSLVKLLIFDVVCSRPPTLTTSTQSAVVTATICLKLTAHARAYGCGRIFEPQGVLRSNQPAITLGQRSMSRRGFIDTERRRVDQMHAG
ncbi:hypothetical protein EIP91_000376 [Steccherinum ochraceum]|uniref:Uncharacterized protein n=1 Tax=Steccherinum ochraceum TaxID=92696 RepID=A0A4R0RFT4_9APHY|nr:hypothetical protein EIP91_000376 [Steccherinum ochraceum]